MDHPNSQLQGTVKIKIIIVTIMVLTKFNIIMIIISKIMKIGKISIS